MLALLSVTDKTGIVPFAKGLKDLGYELLSTGGTAEAIRQAGIKVTEVAAYTGSPEIMDGRVKTLHPKIHGGLLFDRDDLRHRQEAEMQGIRPIDILVVNLYRFEDQAVRRQLSLPEAINYIDVGGPTMLRAAAKNWQHVLSVIDPEDYEEVLKTLGQADKSACQILAQRLAGKVFAKTAAYDLAIASYFAQKLVPTSELAQLPTLLPETLKQVQPLRYGENPHQAAGLYAKSETSIGFGAIELLQGKELSYNNLLDLDAACALSAEFTTPAVVIVKHTNPCGTAVAPTGNAATLSDGELAELFKKALACDPKSAFGGIVALNGTVGAKTAAAVTEIFTECVAAPDFTPEALQVFAAKKNLRLLRAPFARYAEREELLAADKLSGSLTRRLRTIFGGVLVQQDDLQRENPETWQLACGPALDAGLKAELLMAMIVAKHVKSNAIVYANNGATLAVGAGQMSRIDAATFAAEKALSEGRVLKGSVLASDAFFPFRDTVDLAAKYGVRAIIQPGGSMRDQESIDAAKEHGITMVLTGVRHFKH